MALAGAVTQLAALDVATWQGLPARLDWHASTPDDVPAAATLGAAFEPADVVSLGTPSSAAGARAWLRDGRVVLIDVALDTGSAALPPPDSLGEPERRLDVTYGLRHLPSGERVYAARGLALVVDDERVRHVIGFVPCGVDEYEHRLRIRFETTRRPLAARLSEEDL